MLCWHLGQIAASSISIFIKLKHIYIETKKPIYRVFSTLHWKCKCAFFYSLEKNPHTKMIKSIMLLLDYLSFSISLFFCRFFQFTRSSHRVQKFEDKEQTSLKPDNVDELLPKNFRMLRIRSRSWKEEKEGTTIFAVLKKIKK